MTDKPASAPHVRNGDAKGSGDYDVLILDASMKQSLSAVRSLGRAGLRVAAGESVAQFDEAVPLPTFRSRYCLRSLVLPDLVTDAPAFVAAVIEFVRKHSPRVLLPTGDVTIGVLRPHREQLAELGCVLALAPESVLEIANDKDRTLALAEQLGIAHPKSLRIRGADDLAAAIEEFGFPFVLKPTVSWTQEMEEHLFPVDVISSSEASEVTEQILKAGSGVLAQQWLPGRREGVTLFIAGDQVAASCGHVAHRTAPPLGGASVVRESIQPYEILDVSVLLVKAMGLQGTCEVEFRRDAANRPLLMEVNARLAGTIENAVQAGIDFPLMVWRWAAGLEVEPVTSYRTGVRTRWLHGDLRWLRQNWHRSGRPDGMSHGESLYTFVAEFAKTYHYDYFDRHDPMPFLAELRHTVHILRKK
jgi:predicted ATP-grasp superfamily ATP-dependent carboligase